MSNRNTCITANGRACAECRRLKHKCDRQLPCSNCVKKGCGDICPEGTNATGDGHRRFWSQTHELKDTLRDLAGRIAALESALRISHAINASSPHPLLEADLLKIKEPYLRVSSTASVVQPVLTTQSSSSQDSASALTAPNHPSVTNGDTCGMVEALGSLAITRNGRTKYFGPAAMASYFLANEQPQTTTDPCDPILDLLPPDVGIVATAFPLSMFYDREDGRNDRLATLRCFLPSPEEARRYQSVYYMYGTFTTRPVPEQEFNEIIYPIIYENVWGEDDHPPLLPPRNGEGAKYYQLACAALFGSRVIEDPTIEAVQALCLIGTYLAFSRTGIDSNTYRIEWSVIGMATRVAQTMGLHRDPGGFDLPPKEVQRRRGLWWNLYGQDSWNSMGFSLPPALSTKHFDTKWPDFGHDVGANLLNGWRWSHCLECVNPLQQQMTAVARPSYDTIMELDRKLRTHPVPQSLLYRPITTEDLEPAYFAETFQRSISSMYMDISLVLLHRNYCDRATEERPEDPLSHLYGSSVIAVYRSAWAVLAIGGATYEHMAHPATRITCMAHLIFTAVAALCSIITRCPTLTLVPDALLQLDKFYEITVRYQSAEVTFQAISELRQGAHAAYTDRMLNTGLYSADGNSSSQSASDAEQREALLAKLGGKTRRIDYSSTSLPYYELSKNSMVQMGMGLVPVPLQLPAEEIHPDVIEYLKGMLMPQNAVS